MTHFTTKLMMVALSFTMIAGGAAASFGQCHGGGGYGGFSRPSSYHGHSSYRKPSCHTKVIQPQLPPPAFDQSGQQFGQAPQGQFSQSQGQFPQSQRQAPQGQFSQGQGQGQFSQNQGQAQQGQNQGQAPQNTNVASGNQQTPPANTQNNAAGNSAEMSALQLLAGMSGDQTQPQQPEASAQSSAPQAQSARPQNGRVGTWIAKLPNNTNVQLELRADGSFVWTATAKGKTSNFSGNYNVNGESLTLIRGSDNQRLAGTLTDNAGGFNFKLSGAKDSGLNFARG